MNKDPVELLQNSIINDLTPTNLLRNLLDKNWGYRGDLSCVNLQDCNENFLSSGFYLEKETLPRGFNHLTIVSEYPKLEADKQFHNDPKKKFREAYLNDENFGSILNSKQELDLVFIYTNDKQSLACFNNKKNSSEIKIAVMRIRKAVVVKDESNFRVLRAIMKNIEIYFNQKPTNWFQRFNILSSNSILKYEDVFGDDSLFGQDALDSLTDSSKVNCSEQL